MYSSRNEYYLGFESKLIYYNIKNKQTNRYWYRKLASGLRTKK